MTSRLGGCHKGFVSLCFKSHSFTLEFQTQTSHGSMMMVATPNFETIQASGQEDIRKMSPLEIHESVELTWVVQPFGPQSRKSCEGHLVLTSYALA